MSVMTIPNFLTLARLLLIPIFIWLLLDEKLKMALVVFFVAGVTDALDGFIARVSNQKSQLGAYLDPMADKLLLVSSFLVLGHLGLVPGWLVIIAVSRDVMIVLGLVTLTFFAVTVKIEPVALSKLNTLLQISTVLLVLGVSLFSIPQWIYSLLFVSTGLVCMASGFHYIMIGIRALEAQGMRSNDP